MQLTGRWALVSALVGVSALFGCGSDEHGADEEEAVGTSTGAACVSTLTYAADVAPLMTKYCTACHAKSVPAVMRMGAPSDHNFDTEAGILEAAKHIDQMAGAGPNATNTAMPPAASKLPAPTPAERATLSSWLACQAP